MPRMFDLQPTPFDLQFYLGRIPVRVHPGFWIVGMLFGWYPQDFRVTFVVVMCLFVSILIHEVGHALVAEAFGWPSEILLYHFGGLAFSQRFHNHTPWRSIAVSIAGPSAGFALYGLITILAPILFRFEWFQNPYVMIAMRQLIFFNLYWGLVNLAPVLPLDGGQICRSFLEWLRLRNFEERTCQISLVVGGLMAWYFLSHHNRFAGMLFLFLAVQSFLALQQSRSRW